MSYSTLVFLGAGLAPSSSSTAKSLAWRGPARHPQPCSASATSPIHQPGLTAPCQGTISPRWAGCSRAVLGLWASPPSSTDGPWPGAAGSRRQRAKSSQKGNCSAETSRLLQHLGHFFL